MQIDANIPEILRAVDPTLASYTRGDVNYQARALAATHADKFLQHITEIRLDPTIPDSATADALNPEYASRLVRDGLSIMTPTYSLSQEVAFELEPLPERRLKLSTNLDFEMVNRFWRFGPDQQITAAHLLDWILKVHEEFAFAGHFASELVRSPFSSSLLRTKTEDLLAREQSVAVQGAFHNLLFEDARSVREAVNSGERSLLDALELSERGRRFRDWTSTIDVDEDLVREYLRACTAESLPSLSRVVFATSSRTEQWRAGAGGSGDTPEPDRNAGTMARRARVLCGELKCWHHARYFSLSTRASTWLMPDDSFRSLADPNRCDRNGDKGWLGGFRGGREGPAGGLGVSGLVICGCGAARRTETCVCACAGCGVARSRDRACPGLEGVPPARQNGQSCCSSVEARYASDVGAVVLSGHVRRRAGRLTDPFSPGSGGREV